MPTPTPDNLNGFTSGSNTFDLVTSQLMLVKDDDIYHYDYDCQRAFPLLKLAFGESLHYLCGPGIKLGHTVNIYSVVSKHIFGKQSSDIMRHTNALNDFKPNTYFPS